MEKNSGFATKQIHTGKIEIPGHCAACNAYFPNLDF